MRYSVNRDLYGLLREGHTCPMCSEHAKEGAILEHRPGCPFRIEPRPPVSEA